MFSTECLNRIFHACGEEYVLGPICQLIENLLANEEDWRFKNAGLHILSQVGDYVESTDILKGNLMNTVVVHLGHSNPKVRYATLQAIGQLAMDLKKQFTEEFHEMLVRPMIERLEDPELRVKAHSCAAISNFFENAVSDIGQIYVRDIFPKLIDLMKEGTSNLLMETSITACSSMAESLDKKFEEYYHEVMELLIPILVTTVDSNYKQFKGQLIEAITIMSVCVGMDSFKPF